MNDDPLIAAIEQEPDLHRLLEIEKAVLRKIKHVAAVVDLPIIKPPKRDIQESMSHG